MRFASVPPSRVGLVLSAMLLASAPPASAQTVGDCLLGTAEADLDVNDVRARLFNGGNLFYGGTTVNDRLDSVVQLRAAARTVQNAYELGFFEPQRVGAGLEPVLPDAFGLSRPFPNPFRSAASLTLTVPEDAGAARLSVFDVLGREVAVLADGLLPPGEQTLTLGGAGLPVGVYLVRLRAARQTEALKVLHVE